LLRWEKIDLFGHILCSKTDAKPSSFAKPVIILSMMDGKMADNHEVNMNGEPDAVKVARPVCAVRRFEISLSQTGGTREKFLSYQLTRRRKPDGTTACWGSGACLRAL
jgi:hypothetical protein